MQNCMGIVIAADVTIALVEAGGLRLIHSYGIYIFKGGHHQCDLFYSPFLSPPLFVFLLLFL